MNLTSYAAQVRKPVARPKGDYRDLCSWCYRATASSDTGTCVCDTACGQGMCAADVDAYTPPAVPRFV